MNADKLFIKEFKTMLDQRSRESGAFEKFRIHNLPVPTTVKKPNIKIVNVFINEISEEYFERLNGSTAQLIPNTVALTKRKTLPDGTFKKSDGSFVYQNIPVPRDCVAIASPVMIGIKKFAVKNGVRVEHKPSAGFMYVDFVDSSAGRRYIYILPKRYVFRYNLCCLALSEYKPKNYYKGCKLMLQNGAFVYLTVRPFRNSFVEGTAPVRVLAYGATTNFNADVQNLFNMWLKIGATFETSTMQVKDEYGMLTNLVYEDLVPSLVESLFAPLGDSLTNEKEDLDDFDLE